MTIPVTVPVLLIAVIGDGERLHGREASGAERLQ